MGMRKVAAVMTGSAYIIGNAVLDETFAVEGIPAPGQSVFAEAAGRELGGKGANQAVVMARCGVGTLLIAAIGEDAEAEALAQALAEEGLPEDGLVRKGPHPTDRSIVMVDRDGENAILTTSGTIRLLDRADMENGLRGAKPGDALLLQGNLAPEATREALLMAKARGLVRALNPSPVQDGFRDLFGLCDMLFLNRAEAGAFTGLDAVGAGASLTREFAAACIVTTGVDGAVLARGGETRHVPAAPARALDTRGAGDAFMAVAVASCLRRAADIDPLALTHGAAAAAIAVSRHGTRAAFPNADELAAILAS